MRAPHGFALLTVVCTMATACAVGDPDGDFSDTELAHGVPAAKLQLTDRKITVGQTGAQSWQLEKTGVVNASTKSVTWNLVATQASGTTNTLALALKVDVKNSGNTPATIGNVVVRLQKKYGASWVTMASNVANATIGDAATSAKIVSGSSATTVSESAGSGTLAFSNANTQSPISLSPQISLGAGVKVPVEIKATFNNSVLAIANGTRVRAQVVVTFGNASPGSGSVTNVDIDGNGGLEADEARVRSESVTFDQKPVPAPTSSTTNVALSDTQADITTTGTVTFTNAVSNLGATTGTVTVNYAGGADGGTLSNCGHLTGTGVDITDCDTQVIPREFEWHDGDQTTYSQVSWGIAGATSLFTGFDAVYTGTGGLLTVGLNYVMAFTGASYVISYLPETGSDGALVRNWLNPTSTEAGYFGANVVALQLDVDFADQNRLPRALATPFGDLTLCNFPTQPLLEGMTVRDLVADLNSLLGGGTGVYPIFELSVLSAELSAAFDNGVVSQFARDHLMVGACP